MFIGVLIHKDKDSCFGVTVPDIIGCHSAGDTVEEALKNVRNAIYSHLLALADGREIDLPVPTPIEVLMERIDLTPGAFWGMVLIVAEKPDKTIGRVGLSVRRDVLLKIDARVAELGLSRSSYLTQLAEADIKKAKNTK